MKITLIEPFFSGSHACWAKNLQSRSIHDLEILSLPGENWKQRMRVGAIELSKKFNSLDYKPHCILATDMLDVASFCAYTRDKTHNVPVILYFHENQLTYPWSPKDKNHRVNQRQLANINISSALAATEIWFNSQFHMRSFLNALTPFLKTYKDLDISYIVSTIEKKSKVIPVGIDSGSLDLPEFNKSNDIVRPLYLWNHRWEYDKNPEDFFSCMQYLKREGKTFSLAILGEAPNHTPDLFLEAQKKFAEEIIFMGYAKSKIEYIKWLHEADIIPVTSIHDFFGISVLEAAYCKTVPVLPVRLTYPDLFPKEKFNDLFYSSENEMFNVLEAVHGKYESMHIESIHLQAAQYSWDKIISLYDSAFKSII